MEERDVQGLTQEVNHHTTPACLLAQGQKDVQVGKAQELNHQTTPACLLAQGQKDMQVGKEPPDYPSLSPSTGTEGHASR